MPTQLSVAVRNAQADALETAIGSGPILRIRSGALPANCAAADAGTVLAEITLPADWLTAASAGTKSKVGTWEDASANATGTAAHWRIYDSGGTVCHMQGDCTATGGGGAMELSTLSLIAGGSFTVTAFSYTRGNA